SVCARKVSLADPRLAVPVRIKLSRKRKYGPHYRQLRAHLDGINKDSVIDKFNEVATTNVVRMATIHGTISATRRTKIFDDARTLDRVIAHSSVDLIITSPPYAGAQKYIRSSRSCGQI